MGNFFSFVNKLVLNEMKKFKKNNLQKNQFSNQTESDTLKNRKVNNE